MKAIDLIPSGKIVRVYNKKGELVYSVIPSFPDANEKSNESQYYDFIQEDRTVIHWGGYETHVKHLIDNGCLEDL